MRRSSICSTTAGACIERDLRGQRKYERIAVAKAAGTKILRTPIQAPRANAVCERFLRSVRAECLDRVVTVSAQQLLRVLREYVGYFNGARLRQAIDQRVPAKPANDNAAREGRAIARPVLGGLHHAYCRAA